MTQPQILEYASPNTPSGKFWESPAFAVFTWDWRYLLIQTATRAAGAGSLLTAAAVGVAIIARKDPTAPPMPIGADLLAALAIVASIVAALAAIGSWWVTPRKGPGPLGATVFAAIEVVACFALIASFRISATIPLRDWITFGAGGPQRHTTALLIVSIALPLLAIWLVLSWFYGPRRNPG